MNLQKIEIDFDIHKMIETERQSFEEPPYIALRRLLKLPELDKNSNTAKVSVGEGRPFIEDGVTIPHGSFARMKYQRGTQVYEGRFLNGHLVVDNKSYNSLSGAAGALAVKKDGTKNLSLNGWDYWEAKLPNEDKWRALKQLRADVA